MLFFPFGYMPNMASHIALKLSVGAYLSLFSHPHLDGSWQRLVGWAEEAPFS
jgi:hypothetical protein